MHVFLEKPKSLNFALLFHHLELIMLAPHAVGIREQSRSTIPALNYARMCLLILRVNCDIF